VNCNNLNDLIARCTLCPRLVAHREQIAVTKRKAYLAWDYWGKPVPSFGDSAARLLILGLAPGAHGANRTGRMFTGDRSGEFLYRSLYRAGFASQAESREKGDGLELRDAWITAAAHCAPPDNKPTPEELRNCRPFLTRELELLGNVRLVVALGKIATDAWLQGTKRASYPFGHGAFYPGLRPALLCSYHPSQQNTSTGRLTQQMLDDIFAEARRFIES
jgi:uracil-DNA glycosylase family 4